MSTGTPLAFTLLRVPRGAARPSEEAFRSALARDREQLRLPSRKSIELEIAGPYPVIVNDTEFDEYTAWER